MSDLKSQRKGTKRIGQNFRDLVYYQVLQHLHVTVLETKGQMECLKYNSQAYLSYVKTFHLCIQVNQQMSCKIDSRRSKFKHIIGQLWQDKEPWKMQNTMNPPLETSLILRLTCYQEIWTNHQEGRLGRYKITWNSKYLHRVVKQVCRSSGN